MTQYQSFPDTSGDSLSLQKLKALHLPPLSGRSFLDVGCNEGFFCGYAKFDGARRVVGLDKSADVLKRARKRFPECEFLQQDWSHLPAGPFDVILLASALHYADDQAQLIQSLVGELAPDGTLVLEMGVHPGVGSEWVKVKRSIDERFFPTLGKLEEVFKPYAWKRVSPSVTQQGDPLPRYVFHVRHRRPVAYLLMEAPGFGKSTIARELFGRADVPVVSGDSVITRVSQGSLAAPTALATLVKREYSPLRIDQVTLEIARVGLLQDLVALFLQEAGGRDFALDAFIPRDRHAELTAFIGDQGYMPVRLTWNRVGDEPPANDAIGARAEAYFRSLGHQVGATRSVPSRVKMPFKGTTGAVDHATIEGGWLTVRGWALDESGDMPRWLRLRIGPKAIDLDAFDRQPRPDVQKHFGLSHAICGYVVRAALDQADGTLEELEMFGGSSPSKLNGPFRKSPRLTEARQERP